MKKKQKVAKIILMDFPWDSEFGRQVQMGICRYAQSRCLWAFTHISSSYDRHKWLLQIADGAGIISMRKPQEYTAVARRYGLTAVGIGVWAPTRGFSDLPYADVDPRAIGKMAAEYFIERGFRNFGMITSSETFHSSYRSEAFVEVLRRRKFSCDVFDREKEYPPCGEPLPTVINSSERLRRWLTGLHKPLAVFCFDDSAGFWVCAVCQRSGIHVPEEVAVLGAGDDEMFCSMSHPHLSSIQIPAEQVGFEAARMLDKMISGEKPPKKPVLLPPMGVMTRQSTDVMAIENYYVVKAVRYIREHACDGINVESVLAQMPASRRMLERQFRKALGRGIFAEIRRVQIERAKMLLAQTDITIEAAADECGFKSVSRMSMLIKESTGISPGAWRKQFRNQ